MGTSGSAWYQHCRQDFISRSEECSSALVVTACGYAASKHFLHPCIGILSRIAMTFSSCSQALVTLSFSPLHLTWLVTSTAGLHFTSPIRLPASRHGSTP